MWGGKTSFRIKSVIYYSGRGEVLVTKHERIRRIGVVVGSACLSKMFSVDFTGKEKYE